MHFVHVSLFYACPGSIRGNRALFSLLHLISCWRDASLHYRLCTCLVGPRFSAHYSNTADLSISFLGSLWVAYLDDLYLIYYRLPRMHSGRMEGLEEVCKQMPSLWNKQHLCSTWVQTGALFSGRFHLTYLEDSLCTGENSLILVSGRWEDVNSAWQLTIYILLGGVVL